MHLWESWYQVTIIICPRTANIFIWLTATPLIILGLGSTAVPSLSNRFLCTRCLFCLCTRSVFCNVEASTLEGSSSTHVFTSTLERVLSAAEAYEQCHSSSRDINGCIGWFLTLVLGYDILVIGDIGCFVFVRSIEADRSGIENREEGRGQRREGVEISTAKKIWSQRPHKWHRSAYDRPLFGRRLATQHQTAELQPDLPRCRMMHMTERIPVGRR